MHVQYPHPWQVGTAHARIIQDELAAEVERADRYGPVRYVGGVDIGFEDAGTTTRAALVVLQFPELVPVERVVARRPTDFPYVPGLLSFREIPALLTAFDAVRILPDVILCDGQGIAHPRRFGLACHLGVLLDRPSIGVAKQRLIGDFAMPPQQRGAWTPLVDKGETIGAALRSRVGTRPLFISIGHRISLASAVELVMACTLRYRLPETTRQAHRLASHTPTTP
ncbi:MAG: deoxyribonuclease V [Gammaproteobacteria bacterium]|nr:deoxyribonuclease V [Gammaproteobacteria bacterium]